MPGSSDRTTSPNPTVILGGASRASTRHGTASEIGTVKTTVPPESTIVAPPGPSCARADCPAAAIAEKLNAATGPTALALPLGGVSMIDVEGEDFYDPDADAELFDALRANLDDDVELLELDTDINDETFAETVAAKLAEYMREAGVGPAK